MTDRELLELAAKAAGFKKYIPHHLGRDSFVLYEEEVYSEVKERRVVAEKTMAWNPLTDDGDALRLAVKLSMHMYIFHADDGVGVSYTEVNRNVKERHNNDPYAATRRAIVRAAAALGQP